jgi:hypothetical protein
LQESYKADLFGWSLCREILGLSLLNINSNNKPAKVPPAKRMNTHFVLIALVKFGCFQIFLTIKK